MLLFSCVQLLRILKIRQLSVGHLVRTSQGPARVTRRLMATYTTSTTHPNAVGVLFGSRPANKSSLAQCKVQWDNGLLWDESERDEATALASIPPPLGATTLLILFPYVVTIGLQRGIMQSL